MSETVNQENQATEETGKVFTQDEVNAIVKDRLTRAGAKYADYDALKEKAESLISWRKRTNRNCKKQPNEPMRSRWNLTS